MGHLVHVKLFYGFFFCNNFLIAFRGPAQQGQVIQQGFRQIAHGLELFHGLGAVTFGQLTAVRGQDHGHVAELGHFKAQGFIQQNLLGGVGNVFFRPQHVGHAHQMVVDNNSEVVSRGAVGLGYHKIIELAQIKIHSAMDQVMDPHVPLHGNLEPDGMGFSRRQSPLHFLLGKVAAGAGITEGLLPLALDLPLGFQLFRGAEAVIGLAFIQ